MNVFVLYNSTDPMHMMGVFSTFEKAMDYILSRKWLINPKTVIYEERVDEPFSPLTYNVHDILINGKYP